MCSFFLLFLSFPLLGANVNAKKRRETTNTRRERRRERKKSEDACSEDDGRRSCGDDKRIGENNERHWGKRSSPSDKARRLDAFCVENYAFLCTGTCIVDYARRVYIKPRADRGLKCQPRAGYLRRDRNKEGGSARDESSPPHFMENPFAFRPIVHWNPFACDPILFQNLHPASSRIRPRVRSISAPRFNNLRLI